MTINKKNEILLKTINIILHLLIWFPIIMLILSPIAIILCAFGGMSCVELSNNNNSIIFKLLNFDNIYILILITGFIALIILGFNFLMKRLIKKNNNDINNSLSSIKVKKYKYILCAQFLGIFGIHKFLIKDNASGKIRLLLFILPIILNILFINFEFNLIMFITFMSPIAISIALIKSDIVIAKAKITDENGMISF